MNFLAHLFLSQEQKEWMVGNFMGDFVRKRDDALFPPGIQEGLRLHRKIDSFTDTHSVVKESTRLLQPIHHKYAPVLMDVFYDFLLVKNWMRFSKQSLVEFTQNVYKILENYLDLMPPDLQRRLPLMIADNWLMRYGEWDGLAFTFERMKRRASQPAQFDHAVDSLQLYLEPLNQGFLQFFPDAISYVKSREWQLDYPSK